MRRWYAERIFGPGGRGELPPAFRPLERPATGRATVEGCRGGGKNILEVRLLVDEGRVAGVSLSCNLCNPAMLVAADIVGRWLLGRVAEEVRGLDARARETLAPWFAVLEAPDEPSDAAAKFRYALAAVQNALRDDLGWEPLPIPDYDEAEEEDRS